MRFSFQRLFPLGLCVLLDQAIKGWVQQNMVLEESFPLWPGVFHITYVQNTGAAFSLFHQYPQILLWVAGLLFMGFFAYFLFKPSHGRVENLALTLILAGALGNLIDRIQWGYVLDYLDFTLINYPIFNLADILVCTGVGLLVLWTLTHGSKETNSLDTTSEGHTP